MSVEASYIAAQPAAGATFDAGFWRRLIALILDWVLVSAAVSTGFLLAAAWFPELGEIATLEAPFGLFTTQRTLETKSIESTGTKGAVFGTEKVVERTVVGRWHYLYRVTETTGSEPGSMHAKTTQWQQIDPATRQDIETTSIDEIVLAVLLIYWILMEASRFQGSLGKLAMGLKVVDSRSQRLTATRAAGRNLLKFVSALLLFIGFLMSAWTRRKQALHDRIGGCYVVRADE